MINLLPRSQLAPNLRIAQVAPPMESVPPAAYGGTERVVYDLVRGLHERGHRVTTFASGDSEVPGELVATVDKALRGDGFEGDPDEHFRRTIALLDERLDEFDIVHLHLEVDLCAGACLDRAGRSRRAPAIRG